MQNINLFYQCALCPEDSRLINDDDKMQSDKYCEIISKDAFKELSLGLPLLLCLPETSFVNIWPQYNYFMIFCLFSAFRGEAQEFRDMEQMSDSQIHILPAGVALVKALGLYELICIIHK